MCGLVGVLDINGASAHREGLLRASASLQHRGPDDDGLYLDGPVGFAFRRLSILDLSTSGRQPMASPSGRWMVVFNGEIYNFIELREILQQKGVHFRTETDTEVLAAALDEWGLESFDRFNGMWAVLAWDRTTSTLYACRDPWGIKPLFVARHGDATVFASEIKAFRAFGWSPRGANSTALTSFIRHGELDTSAETVLSGVERLLPGRLYVFQNGMRRHSLVVKSGVETARIPHHNGTIQADFEYIEAFREAFSRALKLRLRADVPIGTCMSGGLDSTSITCLAAQPFSGGRTAPARHAFTVLFAEFDESAYIRAVVEQTGVEWHLTLCTDDQVTTNIDAFIAAHDEPVHSLSAFAGYLVMQLAGHSGVKVLLNGQGADELLAGYDSASTPFVRSMARGYGALAAVRAILGEWDSAKGRAEATVRAGAGMARSILPDEIQISLLRRQLTRARLPLLSDVDQPQLPPHADMATWLQSNLLDQQLRSPLPLYLRIEDTNSSAFSMESRLPFLDPEVIALARAAPVTLLRRDGWNKYLLREAMRGVLPEVVRTRRDKMGFPIPTERWWRGPLAARVPELMRTARLERRGLYDVPALLAEVKRFQEGAPLQPWLGRVLLLELWANHHLDGAT